MRQFINYPTECIIYPPVDALFAQLLESPRRPRRGVVTVDSRDGRGAATRRGIQVRVARLANRVVEDEDALRA